MNNEQSPASKHSKQSQQSPEFEQELRAFLDTPSDGEHPSIERTTKPLAQELERSQKRFVSVFSVLSLAGFLGSLALCAQNAFGLTGFSNHAAMLLHRLPDPWCALACGVVFAAPTTLLYALALDRFQWRRLTLSLWWLPLVTALVACLMMLAAPQNLQHDGMLYDHASGHAMRDRYDQLSWLVVWVLGSLMPFGLVALRQARLRVG
jgi:hypothetical protein